MIDKKTKKNRIFSPFLSSTIKNSIVTLRTSNVLYSLFAVAIFSPIAILFQNRIVAAMDTRILGNYMAVAFNILIILLLTLSSNVIVSSTFSKEGNSSYLNKVNPVEYRTMLTGKFVLNAIICICSIIASTAIMSSFANFTVIQSILICFSLIFVYLGHLFWSAEFDLMNPQNRLYQTTGSNHKNPNETKSTISAFIISAMFTFVCFFLMNEDLNVMFFKVFFIGLVLLLIRIYLYFTRIKLYYKEK